jgi:alpha-1,6-mannosyltransferase
VIRIGGRALPYDPTYHLLWRVDKVRAIVSRERPDVLEIDSPYVAAAGALACPRSAFGVRTFLWHADFIDTYLRVMLERRAWSREHARATDAILEPLWALVRGIGRGCDATICGARWQVDKLTLHGVPRVVHVPFGVDKAVFNPAARDEAARRALLASFDGAPTPAKETRLVVAIGRFAWEKRWDVVLDAYLRLAEKVPARLVCFGDGPERAAMQARVAGRADIRFEGFLTDRPGLARALASADLLLHSCPFETFGLGVAEAVASGCPVVVPDLGGAAELAFGDSSVRYRALDPEACAAAAIALLARDPAGVRDAALAAISKIAGVEDQFRQTLALYEDLLAKRASA